MADGLKLGLYGLHRGGSADPDTMVRRARLAEEAGFESLWVGDHIALPSGLGDPPDQPRIEAVVALAHMAALTSRVRLCFGVIVLPQRQPVLLAKQLASIDVLSKGRLTVGVGVGYVEPELRALGVSLADRGPDRRVPGGHAGAVGRADAFVRGALRRLRRRRRAPAAGAAAASADHHRWGIAFRLSPRRPERERLVRLGPGCRADRPGAGGVAPEHEPVPAAARARRA